MYLPLHIDTLLVAPLSSTYAGYGILKPANSANGQAMGMTAEEDKVLKADGQDL